MNLRQALEECNRREKEIKESQKKERDEEMAAICRLLNLGNGYRNG